MKVLIVTSRFPVPSWRGNQIRTVEWLRAMEGWERAVVCPLPAESDSAESNSAAELGSLAEKVYRFPLRSIGRALGAASALVRGRPIQEGLYDTPAGRRAMATACRDLEPDVVVVQMIRCGWALDAARSQLPGAAVLFDAIDAMGLHFDRASRSANPALRWLYRTEAARCRRRERILGGSSDAVTVVSNRDLVGVGADTDGGHVVPVSGRDMGAERRPPDRPTVLLSGNLGYRPTVRGAQRFAREVWPELAARVDGVRWVIAGARPSSAVRRLERLPGVEVHGDVPDLSPYLASASVAIAPMDSGSGVPMKVLEAWSARLPVVAHPWAAWGLAGEGAEAVAIAANPDQWTQALVEILTNEDRAQEMGERGRTAWEKTYSFEKVAERIRSAVTAAQRRLG
jgi:glycosyltransferase involved in cell wall biosynthesis